MLAIQADEDGIPRVVELGGTLCKVVDSDRWQEILAMVGLSGQNIVPVLPPHTADELPGIRSKITSSKDVCKLCGH